MKYSHSVTVVILSILIAAVAINSSFGQISTNQHGTNRIHRFFGLNAEQTTRIRTATRDLPEMNDLMKRLTQAESDAVTVSLDPNASEAKVREKIEAVAKIQTDIALLRYMRGVRTIVPSISRDQKNQINQVPGITYEQLFSASTGGIVRGGSFSTGPSD